MSKITFKLKQELSELKKKIYIYTVATIYLQ